MDRTAILSQRVAFVMRLKLNQPDPQRSNIFTGFYEFALDTLPSRVYETLIKLTHEDRLVEYISHDSTAITVQEKPIQKQMESPSANGAV